MGDRDSCAWRERFQNGISAISHKTTGAAIVVADVIGKYGGWEMALAEVKGGRAIIAAGECIVENNSVCFIITVNFNSIQQMIFYLGSGWAIVNWVIEVTDGEQLKP